MITNNPEDLTEQEKVVIGLKTLESFWDVFGENDIYKQVFLEEVMKFLMDGKE